MNELRRLQKKLIPVNIVVAIISLVAALSIMFAPILTIDLGTLAEQIAEISAEENEDAENSETDNMMGIVLSTVGDMKISLTTYGMLSFAFSENPTDFIMEVAEKKIKEVEDNIIATVAVEILPKLIENSDLDLGIDKENIDVPAILDKFDGVLNAKTEEETRQAIGNLVDEIQAQAVTTEGEQLITEEMKEEIEEVIQQLIDDAKAELGDEELTLESLICVTISKMMNGDGFEPSDGARKVSASVKAIEDEPESGKGTIYTNYRDLINGMMSASEDGESKGDSFENWLPAMLDTGVSYVKYFAIAMSVFAGIWVIQFLFAFLHIFGKNKRFMMWYTKLFGLYPCFIFGIAPILAASIVTSLFPEAAAALGVLGAISTLTWISGVCYLLLWLVSIFWAFPIKHKIRKLLNAGATYN